MMLFAYLYVRYHGAFVMDIPRKYHKLIIIRAIAGFTGVQGMFSSVKYLPVSTAGTIFFTQPIWTALLAWVFAKETLSIYDIISIFTAFLGVLIINNPWQETVAYDTHSIDRESFKDVKVYTAQDTLIGSIYAITGAIGAATAFLCMRIMRNDIHYSVSPFWLGIGCTSLSPLFSMGQMAKAETTTVYNWELVFPITVASVGSFFA